MQCFPYMHRAAADRHCWNTTSAAEERGEGESGLSLVSLETNGISFCAMDALYPGQSHTYLKRFMKINHKPQWATYWDYEACYTISYSC